MLFLNYIFLFFIFKFQFFKLLFQLFYDLLTDLVELVVWCNLRFTRIHDIFHLSDFGFVIGDLLNQQSVFWLNILDFPVQFADFLIFLKKFIAGVSRLFMMLALQIAGLVIYWNFFS